MTAATLEMRSQRFGQDAVYRNEMYFITWCWCPRTGQAKYGYVEENLFDARPDARLVFHSPADMSGYSVFQRYLRSVCQAPNPQPEYSGLVYSIVKLHQLSSMFFVQIDRTAAKYANEHDDMHMYPWVMRTRQGLADSFDAIKWGAERQRSLAALQDPIRKFERYYRATCEE